MNDFQRGLNAAAFECKLVLMDWRAQLSDANGAKRYEILVVSKAIKECIDAINTQRLGTTP